MAEGTADEDCAEPCLSVSLSIRACHSGSTAKGWESRVRSIGGASSGSNLYCVVVIGGDGGDEDRVNMRFFSGAMRRASHSGFIATGRELSAWPCDRILSVDVLGAGRRTRAGAGSGSPALDGRSGMHPNLSCSWSLPGCMRLSTSTSVTVSLKLKHTISQFRSTPCQKSCCKIGVSYCR
jgi:hypothetical protein